MATYLVDLENTGLAGLAGLEELSAKDKVIVFYGTRTGSIAFDKHVELTKAKADVTYTKTERVAKNYLDFQLVTYLGYLIGSGQERVYYIISKDKGYDSCIEFWRKTDKQVAITRCESLQKQKAAAQTALPQADAGKSGQAGAGKSGQTPQTGNGKSGRQTSQSGRGRGRKSAVQTSTGAGGQPETQEGSDKSMPSAEQTGIDEGMQSEQNASEQAKSERTVSEGNSTGQAAGKKPPASQKSQTSALPESMRKKIRKAVKEEGLGSGSYKFLYDYVVRSSDKQKLNIALVKHFQQEKGNRLYKEIVDVFAEYHKQKEAEA